MIYLQSIKPAENRFRWYSLHVQPTLFGGVDLIRRWGRLGSSGGSERIDHFADEESATRHIKRIVRRRERHDYVPVRRP